MKEFERKWNFNKTTEMGQKRRKFGGKLNGQAKGFWGQIGDCFLFFFPLCSLPPST
jgi:hypothetical protein